MSESLHVCQICGKWFATAKAVYGHQRVHSEFKRIWGLKKPRVCSVSTSTDPLQRGYTEIEKHEINEAAMSLVMISQGVSLIRNLPPGDVAAMDLELKSMREKNIHCVDQSKQEFSEVLSTTCSDVVAHQALPSPLTKRESNFSYRFKICGKSFERSLGGHKTLHRSNRGQLACEKEEFEAKKGVPQPSCFGVSQEELIEHRDSNVKERFVERRQDFSEAHLSLKKSSGYSDVVAQETLLFPLRSSFQETPESNSTYKCKVCGKSFGCFQALGGHQRLHRSSSVILGSKRKRLEDDNSPSGSSQAKKIVPQPSSVEVSREELSELKDTNVKEHFVELKQDFEKCSTSSDVLAQALPSPLRCNVQKSLQSNSSYERVLKML